MLVCYNITKNMLFINEFIRFNCKLFLLYSWWWFLPNFGRRSDLQVQIWRGSAQDPRGSLCSRLPRKRRLFSWGLTFVILFAVKIFFQVWLVQKLVLLVVTLRKYFHTILKSWWFKMLFTNWLFFIITLTSLIPCTKYLIIFNEVGTFQ